ncbi:MAG TPA: hypothetical protein VIU38_02955 [Anaerolineales bacterium]
MTGAPATASSVSSATGQARRSSSRRGAALRLPAGPALVLSLAIILGIGLRLSAVTSHDFPLNDGGLFYTMVQDLLRNSLRNPLYTSYNNAEIPFVYPPLGLYLAALLTRAGIPLRQVFRFLPLLFSVLSIPVAYRLSRKLLDDPLAAAFCALGIAILPESFAWRIMGGGITRAPGFLLGLLTLNSLLGLFDRPTRGSAIWTGVFGAATVLAHPEATVHIGLGALILLGFRLRHRQQLLTVIFAGGLVVAIAAPWWVQALAAHGWTPWMSAARSRDWMPWYVYAFRLAADLDALTLVLALLGAIVATRRNAAFLLTYMALMFIVLPRSAPQYAILPVGMLFGIGTTRLLQAVLRPLDGAPDAGSNSGPWVRSSSLGLSILLLFSLVHNWASTVTSPYLQALNQGEQAAMDWVKDNTPGDSQFLIVEGKEFYVAKDAEWLPALTGRTSAIAVQGNEWLPAVDIRERSARFADLQRCGFAGIECLDAWADSYPVDYDYIFAARSSRAGSDAVPCCQRLIDSLAASEKFEKVYMNADAAVYRRLQ